jgi:hypothetical protein
MPSAATDRVYRTAAVTQPFPVKIGAFDAEFGRGDTPSSMAP